MRHGMGWKVMVALLAGGVLATGCRPENPQGSRTQDPINQQQKSPAAGYTKETGPTQQGSAPGSPQEHPAHTGTGEQARKAQEEPGGELGNAAAGSAQEQLEQMKKEEQEKNEATGGSGAQDGSDER